MRISTEWIEENVRSRYLVEGAKENKGKVEFEKLDDETKKKIEKLFVKIVNSIDFLQIQGFLSPNNYKDLLMSVYDFSIEYCGKDLAGLAYKIDEITMYDSESMYE